MSDDILRFENVSKTFPGVRALKDVSFAIRRGDVHVLLGENGAGKSTLIKILTGVYQADEGGTIYLNNAPTKIHDTLQSRSLGIGTVFQENSLIPHLNVAENVFLTRELRGKTGAVDWKRTYQECERWIRELGVDHINPHTQVRRLSVADQQIVEIVKVFSQNPSIVILDEPTSALSDNEIDNLFRIIETLKAKGVTFIEVMCVTYTLEKAREFSSFSLEGFNFGDTVVVQGAGPLGIAHIAMARMLGAGKIIATDISDYKLEIAKAFGADIVINAETTTAEERIARIKAETNDRGAEIVVECVGRPEVFPEGLKYLRKAGMYLEPGNFVDCGGVDINVHEICANNLRIVGMTNHTHTKYKTVMEMMLRTKERFPWDRLFSHRYSLEETEQAIRTSMTKESMKVLIDPWA